MCLTQLSGPTTGVFPFCGSSNTSGQLSFSYVSFVPGIDVLQASFHDDAGNLLATSNTVTKEWIVPQITLSPATATNVLGEAHTLTATVTTPAGEPAEGVQLAFQFVSGPNMGQSLFAGTDASGQAVTSYVGLAEGIDVIRAVILDPAGNVVVTSNTVTKEWVAAPAPS